MQWIDDMFVSMETERAAAALAKGNADKAKVSQAKHVKKQIPGALSAWTALVSSITTDVNEFNKHKARGIGCGAHVPKAFPVRSLLAWNAKQDAGPNLRPERPPDLGFLACADTNVDPTPSSYS